MASLILSSVSGSVFAEPPSDGMDEAILSSLSLDEIDGSDGESIDNFEEEAGVDGYENEEQEEEDIDGAPREEQGDAEQEEQQPGTEQEEQQPGSEQEEQQPGTEQEEQQPEQGEGQQDGQSDDQIQEEEGSVDSNNNISDEDSESDNEIDEQAESGEIQGEENSGIQEGEEGSTSANNIEETALSENSVEETVSDNIIPGEDTDLTLSGNEVSGNEVSENSISENEVSENAVSENEVSENEVSENEIKDSVSKNEAEEETEEEPQYYGGNIDMFMDFESDTVEEISEASDARLASLASSGEAGLSSLESEKSQYYVPYEKYIGNISNNMEGISENSANDNRLCWAYTAAALADINLVKKGYKGKDEHVDPIQIAQATYNKYRYDSYGETWKMTSETPYFDEDKLTEESGSHTNRYWDHTGFIKSTSNIRSSSDNKYHDDDYELIDVTKTEELKTASGNLLFATFNFERWASPYLVGGDSNSDGNDSIDSSDDDGHLNFEADTSGVGAQLQNAYWVPSTDIEAIKAMIVDHGAVGIQMNRKANGPNKTKLSGLVSGNEHIHRTDEHRSWYQFIPIYNGYRTDHTVALVGWDDSVGKDCFKKWNIGDRKNIEPSRTGAFLALSPTVKGCKDKDYTYDYFWISYDDAAFKAYNSKYRYAVAYDFAENDTSDYSYGYDGSNYFNSFSTKKVYGIFKSGHSGKTGSGNVEVLKSIGVGVQDAGRYRLTIYSGYDPTGKRYLNQYEVLTQQIELSYPGYHTVELDEPILFYKNDTISVCFEKVDSTDFHMLVDGFYDPKRDNYTSKSTSGERVKGCSIASENGVLFSSFTNGTRVGAESFFMSVSGNNNGSVVQGSVIPYSGSSSKYMGITPRMRLYTSDIKVPKNIDQTMLDVKLKKYIWTHTGKAITPMPEVLVDFSMTQDGIPHDRGHREYPEALVMYNKIGDVESHYNYVGVNNKDTGIAAVIVRGKGDIFSGEISVPFKIVKDQLNISKCKIEGLEPQEYKEGEGKALTSIYGDIKNNMIVKYYVSETKHYVTLTEGIDYTVGSIEGNNTKGKKLTVMVTGIGTFKNTVKPKFKVQKAKDKKPISDRTISVNLKFEDGGRTVSWNEEEHLGELPELNYTGKKLKPEIVSIYDAGTGKLLEPGIDYKAKIKYKKNKTAGMAKIIIKAAKGGPYSGKVTRYFLIKPMHVTTDAVVKFPKSSYKYTGKPIKAIPKVTLYGKRLKKGDIYVDYTNNTGSSSGTATAQGVVFGKGRYTGYMGYGNFSIGPGSSTTTTSRTSSSSSTTSSSSTR